MILRLPKVMNLGNGIAETQTQVSPGLFQQFIRLSPTALTLLFIIYLLLF